MKKPKPDPAGIWIVVRPDRDMHNPLAASPTHRVEVSSQDDLRRMDAALMGNGAKAYRESVYGPFFWANTRPMPSISANCFLSELQSLGTQSNLFIQEEFFLP